MTIAGAGLLPARQVRSGLRRIRTSRSLSLGCCLVSLVCLAALLAPLLTPYDPNASNFRGRLLPPGMEHWFGTDNFGRDLFSRVLYGARISFLIGGCVVVFNAVIGTTIGALAGYFAAVDGVLMRFMDALMAFPAILLAIVISAVLGGSILNVVIALGIATVPYTARVVRASVLVLREMEYVEAARVLGAGELRVLFGHVLINALAPLIVRLSYVFAIAILSESALSYMGTGPRPPTATLGNIIANGSDFLAAAPWVMMFPGLVIIISVLGLNLLGDGLRDILDPRVKA